MYYLTNKNQIQTYAFMLNDALRVKKYLFPNLIFYHCGIFMDKCKYLPLHVEIKNNLKILLIVLLKISSKVSLTLDRNLR